MIETLTSVMKNVRKGSVAVMALAVAYIVAPSLTLAAQVYDFASSTEEAQALQTELADQSLTIVFGAVAAFAVIALALMGAGYVWSKFKKFTGIRKKI